MNNTTNNNTCFDVGSLKVVSMNVRGLRNPRKRRTLFHAFKKDKYDIICLQETHLIESDLPMIKKEWPFPVHLVAGTSNSKGLITLFSNKLSSSNINMKYVNERCMISQVLVNSENVLIYNIYAPCVESEKPKFLIFIKNLVVLNTFNEQDHILIVGDFNTVLDNKLDIVSGLPHNVKTVEKFNNVVNELLLVDIWRSAHPHRKEFTWSKVNPFVARRIDYIFASENLFPFCKDPTIKHLGFSDHKATTVYFDFTTFKRGPSFYKFNTSLLQDLEFVNIVSEEIKRIKSIPDLDPHLCWEYIKISVKDISMAYGRSLAYKRKREKNILNDKITELERHLASFPDDAHAIKSYSDYKTKLELHLVRETEGARIRSGQKWAQEGEKCSKFFLNLEKQRANSNTIFVLEDRDCRSGFARDPHTILELIKTNFENLYSLSGGSNPTYDDVFVDSSGANVLDANDHIILNEELSETELFLALKSLNNNSAPGLDGLPCEVYKMFWLDLKQPLLDAFNHSFQIGNLSQSQCSGVICLHHKGKGLPREKIGSWRPISLTNTDYKIIAKVLARRMNSCLHKCVKPDQYAFVKGRQISDLLRELDDMIEHGKQLLPNSIILSIDYAKAFDTISVSAIKKALIYFGFGDIFCKWVDIIFAKRTSCVSNGGFLSDQFDIQRGVRQGCPVSPLLFIITLELLAIDIRKNNNIKGIKFHCNHQAIKIKMYADDATLFLEDLIDYREVLSRIKLFSSFSGLELNKNKSAAMFFGNTSQKNRIKYGIKFVNYLKILGVWFSNEKAAVDITDNFEPKISQLERICSLWDKRHLTIIGKITILKSFGISLFLHLMQSIGLSDLYIKRINSIMFRFIWSTNFVGNIRTTEKVKREYICMSKECGGLNMIDLYTLQDSFYLAWADKLLGETQYTWKTIPTINFIPVGGLSVFRSSVQENEFKGKKMIKSNFWKTVLFCWIKHNNKDPSQPICDINDPIFNNTYIRFKNRPLFIEGCISRSLLYIKDFLSDGQIINFREFCSRYGTLADSYFAYNIIYNALKKVEEEVRNSYAQNPNNRPNAPFRFKSIDTGNISRKTYFNLLQNNNVLSVNRYLREKYEIEVDNTDIWLISYECVSEVKLIILQWKLLHNIYPTGTLLFKMKMRDNENCDLCGERDSLSHCFVQCPSVSEVWKMAEVYIFKLTNHTFKLDEKTIMVGLFDLNTKLGKKLKLIVNKVCLIGKFTISKYRVTKTGKITILFEREMRIRNMLSNPQL